MTYPDHVISTGGILTYEEVTDADVRAHKGHLLLELDTTTIDADGEDEATLTVTHNTPPLVSTEEPEQKPTNGDVTLQSDGGDFIVTLSNGQGTRAITSNYPDSFSIWSDDYVSNLVTVEVV